MSGVGEEERPHEPTAIGVPSGWFARAGWVVAPSPDPGQTTGMLQLSMAPGGNGMKRSPVERAGDAREQNPSRG